MFKMSVQSLDDRNKEFFFNRDYKIKISFHSNSEVFLKDSSLQCASYATTSLRAILTKIFFPEKLNVEPF